MLKTLGTAAFGAMQIPLLSMAVAADNTVTAFIDSQIHKMGPAPVLVLKIDIERI